MNFKKLIILWLVLAAALLQGSCSRFESPRYVKIADSITDQTAKKIEKEKGLSLCGTGGGMMDDVKFMMMAFSYPKSVDAKEARDLLIYSAEAYLSAINSNPEIRPFLHNYPFTAGNIAIEIYFPDIKDPNLLSVASVYKGRVSYDIRDPETKRLKEILEESYETALQIYKEQHSQSVK
jgi:hypothetical protein